MCNSSHRVALAEPDAEAWATCRRVPGSGDQKEGEVKRIITMLTVVLGTQEAKEEETRAYSTEEIGTMRPRRGNLPKGSQPRELSVERAAELIDELPSDVPRESALRIVRGTLAAVGVEVSNLEKVTRARVSELSSEVGLARDRRKEFREKTEGTVRSLEEAIRKAQEAGDAILAEEEKKISSASAALKEARRVRAFFGFPEAEREEDIGPSEEDTQPLGVVGTRATCRSGPVPQLYRDYCSESYLHEFVNLKGGKR